MKIVITVKDTDNVIGLKEDIAMRLEGVADIVRIDTADFAPKGEVERLIDDFQRTIRADAKVGMSAGEILMHINNMLAEFKNKYTEGKEWTETDI